MSRLDLIYDRRFPEASQTAKDRIWPARRLLAGQTLYVAERAS